MSDRPAFLYLTHRVPYPPDKGDRIRTYNVLRHLASRADVDVVSLADEAVTPDALAALRVLGRFQVVDHRGPFRWVRAVGSLLGGRSVSEGVFWSPGLANEVRDRCRSRRYSAVLASASSLGPYLDLPEVRETPAVVDLMDVDSQKWRDYADRASFPRRLVYSTEAARVGRLERRLAGRTRAMLVVSEAEAVLLRAACPSAPVEVVPNGVDLDYFRPAGQPGDGCVFVGALDYRPNVDGAVWFCREIWPEVRRLRPDARVRLVGRKPAAEVERLAAIGGVEVVGPVPDVRPYVVGSAVAIAPLRIARGVQNKVLEAMAMGRPVVASPQALQGLRGDGELPVVEAGTPEAWVGALAALFGDAAKRLDLGGRGRRYVEDRHGWGPCLAPLDRILGLDGWTGREAVR